MIQPQRSGAVGSGSKVEVTVIEGKPMPPTPKPGQGYTYVDLTKHAKPQK